MAIVFTARQQPAQPAKVERTVERTVPTKVAIDAPKVAGARGRPRSGKVVMTIRLDPDVIARFKATGDGWQARMNEALKAAKV